MVFDRIEHLFRHNLPKTDAIITFLKSNDPLKLPVGEVEIQGRDLFVRTAEYETNRPEEGKFETHRVYADLQYVVRGEEIMQTAPANALEPLGDYDPKTDCQFFRPLSGVQRPTSDNLVRNGEFVFFLPGEAHRPCCSLQGAPVRVKKLVFKIRVF